MNKQRGIGMGHRGSSKLLSSVFISSLFYLLFIFSGARNSYAVDWSGKIGVGPMFEARQQGILLFLLPEPETGETIFAPLPGVALPGVGGGASAVIGLAKMFRLGVELSFLSLSSSYKQGNAELTLSGSGFGVSLSGLLDVISKEGGVLYLILAGGYSSISTEMEGKVFGVSAKVEGPGVSGISVGLGAGVEAFVLNSVGIALQGFILNFFSGTVEERVPTEEGGSVTVSADTSAFNFGLFPSIRLSARIYF